MKFIASSKSQMTDIDKYYVYTGHEEGMINGAWYYWDGSDWSIGGGYECGIDDINETDSTFDIPGMSADAKAIGEALAALRRDMEGLVSDVDSTAIPNSFIDSL